MKRKFYQFSDFAYLMKSLVHYLYFDHAIAFLYVMNWYLLYDRHVLQNKENASGNETQKLKVINPYDATELPAELKQKLNDLHAFVINYEGVTGDVNA